MQNRLESYLEEVQAFMRAVPQASRGAEIAELRHHLLEAVAARQKSGASEEEAVEAALRQFGPALAVAQGIVRAWWRGRLLGWRSSTPGTACVAGLLLCLPSVLISFLPPPSSDFPLPPNTFLVRSVPLEYHLFWSFAVGATAGFLAPRRAVAAMPLGAVAGTLLWQVLPSLLHGVALSTTMDVLSLNRQVLLYQAGFWAVPATVAALTARAWTERGGSPT